jgi:hypothetical protein
MIHEVILKQKLAMQFSDYLIYVEQGGCRSIGIAHSFVMADWETSFFNTLWDEACRLNLEWLLSLT